MRRSRRSRRVGSLGMGIGWISTTWRVKFIGWGYFLQRAGDRQAFDDLNDSDGGRLVTSKLSNIR